MTRRKKMLQQLDNDIREHIEHETQDNIDRGMTPEEADAVKTLQAVARFIGAPESGFAVPCGVADRKL